MDKFPVDAPKAKVIKALEHLGFRLVRERKHIAMVQENPDGSRTPLTMPNRGSRVQHYEQFVHKSEFHAANFSEHTNNNKM